MLNDRVWWMVGYKAYGEFIGDESSCAWKFSQVLKQSDTAL
jgi:hypothetical protein